MIHPTNADAGRTVVYRRGTPERKYGRIKYVTRKKVFVIYNCQTEVTPTDAKDLDWHE